MSDRASKTAAEIKILEALRVYRDRSGPQLSDVTGFGLTTLYPVLMSLEQSGAIESRWYDETGSYPRKRVYRIKETNNG